MAESERIEALILGSGEDGKYLAWHLARSGRRAVVVERRWIGVLSHNQLPTKNEVWSAKAVNLARHAGTLDAIPTQSQSIWSSPAQAGHGELVTMQLQNYKDSCAELIMGSGRFVAPKKLKVQLNDGGTRRLAGQRIILNIGTSPATAYR